MYRIYYIIKLEYRFLEQINQNQAELTPTTNTLGQVADTIRQVADTLKNPELEENHKQAIKYYKPEKLKVQATLTSDQTKAKYMDVFSTITLPGRINRN